MAKEFRFEVTERIAVLSGDGEANTKELNMVSFGEYKPKLDIRHWRNGMPMKGVQLTEEEAAALMAALNKRFKGDDKK